jgi:hypothetical protein
MDMDTEIETRPKCPACGAPWTEQMLNLMDAAMSAACSCCDPLGGAPPDIVCHACRKVLYSAPPAHPTETQ